MQRPLMQAAPRLTGKTSPAQTHDKRKALLHCFWLILIALAVAGFAILDLLAQDG